MMDAVGRRADAGARAEAHVAHIDAGFGVHDVGSQEHAGAVLPKVPHPQPACGQLGTAQETQEQLQATWEGEGFLAGREAGVSTVGRVEAEETTAPGLQRLVLAGRAMKDTSWAMCAGGCSGQGELVHGSQMRTSRVVVLGTVPDYVSKLTGSEHMS